MQLASIVPPPSGHRECYLQITVTMPGVEAHSIVRSQDGIHVMIDYFTDFTLANSDDGLCLESTLQSESRTELRVELRTDYDYNPESWLHCYQATMAIDNRYDEEDVDGATSFQKG